MKKQLIILSILSFGLFFSCNIDQTKEAKLPAVDVDVETKAGQLPEFDIDWAEVNVDTRTTTIEVPKLVIVMEEEEVEIPYIDVDMPNDGEKEEKTLLVEAKVKNISHEINIEEVYVTGNNLYVISRLESTGKKLSDQTLVVSDRLVLNAPDLKVKHYIIGKKPAGNYNNNNDYTYISNKSKISNKLVNGRKIYG